MRTRTARRPEGRRENGRNRPASTPTEPPPITLSKLRRARLERRIVIGIAVLFVAVMLTGTLGPRTSTVSASGGGYTLTVTYPEVTRPGLPVRWEIRVTHPGGFPARITVATTFVYLRHFDISSIQPEPASATADASDLVYGFDPPAGEVFQVAIDAATQVSEQEWPPATTTLVVDGTPAVSVTYSTKVVP
jgi:hypothetical protein